MCTMYFLYAHRNNSHIIHAMDELFSWLHVAPMQINLSFYLDRDASYKEEQSEESSVNPVFGAVLNVFTQFAVIIGRTTDAELKYVC